MVTSQSPSRRSDAITVSSASNSGDGRNGEDISHVGRALLLVAVMPPLSCSGQVGTDGLDAVRMTIGVPPVMPPWPGSAASRASANRCWMAAMNGLVVALDTHRLPIHRSSLPTAASSGESSYLTRSRRQHSWPPRFPAASTYNTDWRNCRARQSDNLH
jgi:hypothetical protein